ncbi:hypothetical protein [Parvularcula oceani]|uniref:hypothetical protein n=1 Tax=Parvularcula oceani TaxID=1247963 RepID=UPI0012DF1721|nr:hypothetical protein [Parvularcula oceani]
MDLAKEITTSRRTIGLLLALLIVLGTLVCLPQTATARSSMDVAKDASAVELHSHYGVGSACREICTACLSEPAAQLFESEGNISTHSAPAEEASFFVARPSAPFAFAAPFDPVTLFDVIRR